MAKKTTKKVEERTGDQQLSEAEKRKQAAIKRIEAPTFTGVREVLREMRKIRNYHPTKSGRTARAIEERLSAMVKKFKAENEEYKALRKQYEHAYTKSRCLYARVGEVEREFFLHGYTAEVKAKILELVEEFYGKPEGGFREPELLDFDECIPLDVHGDG